jgi:hypothetical protein
MQSSYSWIIGAGALGVWVLATLLYLRRQIAAAIIGWFQRRTGRKRTPG